MGRRRVTPAACVLALSLVLATTACTTAPPFGASNTNANDNGADTPNDNGGTTAPNDNTNAGAANANQNANDNAAGTTPNDSDGDGFSDEEERTGIPGSDPFNPNDTPLNPIDSDGDGCSDFDELNFIGFCDANPNTPDTPSNNVPIVVDDPDASFTFSLTVAKHVDATFTDAQIDDKFAVAGAILQSVETECADVATDTTFQRNGPTATFTAGGAALTTETQLDAVFAVAQDVKIVDAMVGVCGIPAGDDLTIVLGCAFPGGSLVITTLADADVWAHEWGHVQNLQHRDDCPRNVMHSFEVNTNAVNAAERDAFLTPTPTVGAPRLGTPATAARPLPALAKTASESLPHWLHRLASKLYLAGVPAAALDGLHPDAVDPLMQMLASPDLLGRHHNVARMLGFTRDARPCDALIEGITSASGALSSDQFATMTESFLALGRLSAYDTGGHVLNWLIEGTDADAWHGRSPERTYRSLDVDRMRRFLARLSVMALGLTGQPAALDYLRSLKDAADAGTDVVFIAQIDEAVVRLEDRIPAARTAERSTRQP